MIEKTRKIDLISIMHADTSKSDIDYPLPSNPTILGLQPIDGHKDIYANIIPMTSSDDAADSQFPKSTITYSITIDNILTGDNLLPTTIPEGSYIFWDQGTLIVESANMPLRCERTRKLMATLQV